MVNVCRKNKSESIKCEILILKNRKMVHIKSPPSVKSFVVGPRQENL